jgi:acetyl/propionyl-CoA carboxylase alpha subunit
MPTHGPPCGALVSNDEAPRANAITIVPLGGGRYQVDDGERRRIAFAVASGDTWVFLDGRVFVLPAAGQPARRAKADDASALMSPMPATVVTIHVAPGAHVERDALLITLEAMKMELPIKAPRRGRIAAIACREGELVQAGVPLMEIDYEP